MSIEYLADRGKPGFEREDWPSSTSNLCAGTDRPQPVRDSHRAASPLFLYRSHGPLSIAGRACIFPRAGARRDHRSAGREYFRSRAFQDGPPPPVLLRLDPDGRLLFHAAVAAAPERRAVRMVLRLLLPDAHVAEVLRDGVRRADARVDARLRRTHQALDL